MNKVLSPDQEALLCFQYLRGKNMRALQAEWGIAIGTVFAILKRHGISRPEQKALDKMNA